jgi:hypothetical protein
MAMTLRNHGAFPTLRDRGGVFSDALTSVTDLKLERDKLMASQVELHARLSPLVAKIQTDATEAELLLVSELGAEARSLNAQLQRTNVVLRVAEEKQTQREADRRRQTFDKLVVEAPAKRAEFAHKFRELCLFLGQLCADVDEAVRLGNELSIVSVVGMAPVDRNSLEAMSAPLNPLPTLLDSGLTPTTSFGWRWNIAVAPLKGK